MKKTIVVVGAGGHARSLITLLGHLNYEVIGICDDSFVPGTQETILGVRLIGAVQDAEQSFGEGIVIAYGDNSRREQCYKKYGSTVLAEVLVHPLACIEDCANVGRASQVYARAYLNARAEVGENVIVNTGAIIEHEARVGNHSHISVGAILCGRVSIGDRCFIGAGAVVIDKVSVCSDVIVGAHAVVIRDITVPGVYVGNPARKVT